MSDKYIVKNCPCLGFQIGYYCSDRADYCKNCTDCRIKQVIEKCKEAISQGCLICNEEKRAKSFIECTDCIVDGRGNFADEILQLFNIEGVE